MPETIALKKLRIELSTLSCKPSEKHVNIKVRRQNLVRRQNASFLENFAYVLNL